MRNSGLKNGPKQNSSAFTLSLTQCTVTESEHKGCFVVSLLQKRRREIKRLAQGHTAGKCHSEYQDHKEPMTHRWQNLVHKCMAPLVFVLSVTFPTSPGTSEWTLMGVREHILARSSESQNLLPGQSQLCKETELLR